MDFCSAAPSSLMECLPKLEAETPRQPLGEIDDQCWMSQRGYRRHPLRKRLWALTAEEQNRRCFDQFVGKPTISILAVFHRLPPTGSRYMQSTIAGRPQFGAMTCLLGWPRNLPAAAFHLDMADISLEEKRWRSARPPYRHQPASMARRMQDRPQGAASSSSSSRATNSIRHRSLRTNSSSGRVRGAGDW